MKSAVKLALSAALGLGTLAFSTSSWAGGPGDGGPPPGGGGLNFEHNFNGATIVSNSSTNLNGAAVIGSGNSFNVNKSSSTSGSCAGICVIGNKISGGGQQQGPPPPHYPN